MMPRKHIAHKKRPQDKKKRGVYFFIQRYFVLSVVCLVFFTGTTVVLKARQAQTTCANSKTCNSDLSEQIDNSAVGIFEGRKVIPPKIDSTIAAQPVLGASISRSDKHIYIDLATQTLYAYEGTKQVLKTFIASGKWGRTPVGNFHIWEKLKATRMAGGEGADAYDLPNVPYVMYFFHDFGLHGAYWHDNFGHTMSHGCVNMRQIDAKVLFDWTDGPTNDSQGTPVSVCDQITKDNQCVQNNPIN